MKKADQVQRTFRDAAKTAKKPKKKKGKVMPKGMGTYGVREADRKEKKKKGERNNAWFTLWKKEKGRKK